jgi:hypothetical protein
MWEAFTSADHAAGPRPRTHAQLVSTSRPSTLVSGTRPVVVTDGFPTGLPAGTPEGVVIAIASMQNREYTRARM